MLATVFSSALNVRSIPNISGRVLGVLPKGTVVDVTQTSNDWLEIQYKDSTGFVSKNYMEINPRTSDVRGIVITRILNVRDKPSVNSAVLGAITNGTRVVVLSQIQDWLEIEFNNSSAFVSNKYVDLFSPGESYLAEVVPASLNVRAKPDRNAPLLGQVVQGMRLTVEATYGKWSEISFNGLRSFVFSNYLRKIDVDEEESRINVADDGDAKDEAMPDVTDAQPKATLEPLEKLLVSGTSEQRKVAGTWNRYGGLLEKLSKEKDIDAACAVAVLCVESSGKGFEQNNDNRMIIRFENHKFWKYWGKKNPAEFRKHFQYDSGKVWTKHKWRKSGSGQWQGFHGSQSKEWQVFEFAKSIDADSAMLSISMGAPQIMGFHFERIGYQSVKEMFDSFAIDISAHINGLFDFFSDSMVRKLKVLDFEGFAAGYNGSGQKEKYGRWIESHYKSFKQIKS
jgi:uncharacterized protein YgiM (DUF1202 family)